MSTQRAISLFIVLYLAAMTGCGGSGGEEVTGSLVYEGKPVANANVVLVPASGPSATATTDAEGKFSGFSTTEGEGVPPGEYTVTVIPAQDGSVEEEVIDYGAPPPPPFPPKYLDSSQSDLRVVVKKGEENTFNLELK